MLRRNVTNRETDRGAAWATGGRLTPRGCEEKMKSAYSRLDVVVEVNNGNIFQDNPEKTESKSGE